MANGARSADGEVILNGVSGIDGSYPHPALTVADLAALARGEELDRRVVRRLRQWLVQTFGSKRRLGDGWSPSRLADAGWGLIAPADADPRVLAALQPLRDWRRQQAAAREPARYRELVGADGYQPGESMRDFLLRHDAELGAVDPARMPYYLLLVGSPRQIPWHFQYDLDLFHAVGRLDFDQPEQYARYAESVVAAEMTAARVSERSRRRMTLFCPTNDDAVSVRMREELVAGLARRLSKPPRPLSDAAASDEGDKTGVASDEGSRRGYDLDVVVDGGADKSGLLDLLGGPRRPDFLFTACHGLTYPPESALQRANQGALLLRRDTTGPDRSLHGADLAATARPGGLIIFAFACFSAGASEWAHFQPQRQRERVTDAAFTAGLPRALLSHPNGGSLAFIGHVNEAWTYSFTSFRRHRPAHLNGFEAVARRVLAGEPVGFALEALNERFAQLAAELLNLKDCERLDPTSNREEQLAAVYCSAKDARNYVILGDPAARLAPAAESAGLPSTAEPPQRGR